MSQKAQTETLQINDAWGEPHTYRIVPHTGNQALKLAWRVLQAASGPVGRLLDSNLGLLIEAFTSDEEVSIESVAKKLQPEFRQGMDDIFEVVFTSGEEWVTRELLRHSYRDGARLSDDAVFNSVYQANSAEMFMALWHAVRVNNFLSLFRSLFGNFVSLEPANGGTTRSLGQPESSASTGGSTESGAPAANG